MGNIFQDIGVWGVAGTAFAILLIYAGLTAKHGNSSGGGNKAKATTEQKPKTPATNNPQQPPKQGS